MASGAYLVNLAEQHASAPGYQFDEAGDGASSRKTGKQINKPESAVQFRAWPTTFLPSSSWTDR